MPEVLPGEIRCLECEVPIGEAQPSVRTERGVFCAGCFEHLKVQVQQAFAAQSRDIDFPRAVIGALLGGSAGAALWWGVTVLTNIRLGLIAIVIGVAVGKGILTLTGGKRAPSLQGLSVAVAVVAYMAGTYLTNWTFILRYLHQKGGGVDLPLIPPDFGVLYQVTTAGFQTSDLVFLAIVVYQAWKIPAPIRVPG